MKRQRCLCTTTEVNWHNKAVKTETFYGVCDAPGVWYLSVQEVLKDQVQ